ncbi:FAD-dependent oxidoreductase [Marinilactibacillus sp. Marseille-P9653]|uniref:FAD-dependent oxidoreductase n=1 Tax=Marinilactibacillus sp. Marseille-P9653 TaxID=2866583 RepID=UPI001CE3D546|nr:FAD-dependent oxidoreductase [Marinilactibacillus sp. Marseille-P9653]
MKVVIIGASFAGVAAALEVRKKHIQAEIVLLEKQATLGYIPNGLHLYWDNQIENLDDARFITQEQLDKERIHCELGATVQKINTKQKVLYYDAQEQEEIMTYDKLIIATGSRQLSEKIDGSNHESVLKYKRYGEAQAALSKVEESQHITIIGGGQVGIEAADLLNKQEKQVTLIESMDYVLFKYLDEDMILPIEQKMIEKGIDLKLRQTVSSIETESDQKVTVHLGEASITSDAVIMGVNVRPNLHFLDDQIELHMDQTIAVDRYLRTSVQDVFAVGDCIQLSGPGEDMVYIPLINNAVRTGIVAAANLMEPTVQFNGSLRTIGTSVFGYFVASTGMTEAESLFTNQTVETRRQTVRLNSLPNSDTVTLKWVYDAETHVLLGAQMISTANILEKINTMALAIQTKQTLEDLQQKDFFFNPSYSQMVSTTNLVSWMEERVEEDES